MINITIILAAGQNTRLKDLCFDSPKGRLSINGQGLVERLCLQFLPYSHDIIVVAGSNIASYKFLETKIPKVKVVGEKDKQHISNSESLYVGLNKINKKTDTITIIEGDVVLSNLAIARYFNSKRNNKFIVTNSPLNDNADKTIYDTKKHLYYIDKDIVSHTICSSIKIIGKYLGVTTFSNSITNSLKKQLKANIKDAYIKSIFASLFLYFSFKSDVYKLLRIDWR